MILGFKVIHKKKPTHFVQKILACVIDEYRKSFQPKPHTIRAGKRWKAGMDIHMATGVRTKNYFQFNENIKGLQKCISVQDIRIEHHPELGKRVFVQCDSDDLFTTQIEGEQLKQLALNDGFDSVEDFWNWFKTDFKGQIIHWTNLRY